MLLRTLQEEELQTQVAVRAEVSRLWEIAMMHDLQHDEDLKRNARVNLDQGAPSLNHAKSPVVRGLHKVGCRGH